MLLLLWMLEVSHYVSKVRFDASEVGHYASSDGFECQRWGFMLQVDRYYAANGGYESYWWGNMPQVMEFVHWRV